MDIYLAIASLVTVMACAVIFYVSGWKQAIQTISFLLLVISLYVIVIKFFGQEGKNFLAFFLLVVAIIVLYRRKKKGGSIWWD
ncbi:MAG: hypothetical protein ACU833_00840 [Gammaproteobacteria bacterium]